MQYLMEKDAFYKQNLSFTQPPRDKGSVDNLTNSLRLQWFMSNNDFIHCVMTITQNLPYIVLEHGATVISEERPISDV